jgi:phosphatidylserine/phosphatidylglycerophosphate/cardiolipin synthase-like enzyme
LRYQSAPSEAGRLFAVCGARTLSFAVAATDAVTAGLLGFAVERVDTATGARHWMNGFKVFPSIEPHPAPGLQVSTFDHPVQSFLWDDFGAEPDHGYTYLFHPVKGTPQQPDRGGPTLSITVRTEPLYSPDPHQVFFNRGAASSQAYVRQFGDTPIDDKSPADRARALAWLAGDLGKAIVTFIESCAAGDTLLGCFYEFRHLPTAEAFKAAIDRGVTVQLIVDGKDNASTDKEGVFHESFPREDNRRTIAAAGLPAESVTERTARPSDIAHNKFMVRITGEPAEPAELWSGSTNLSDGGISGQTNVGHWIRDAALATAFRDYWTLLATDPGGKEADARAEKTRKNAEFERAVVALSPVPLRLADVPVGVTPVFSPRPDAAVLQAYADLLEDAHAQRCVTLAFGISPVFKKVLQGATAAGPISFLLLEKEDRPQKGERGAFVRLDAANNVYEAWGSFLADPVYQWARETNTQKLGLNQHVFYIHSKFMLVDPLGEDPLVVSGSANFSTASVADNDENMVVVRGAQRVADIYLTEFNRLFNHYYFRSITEEQHRPGHQPAGGAGSLFLDETPGWQSKYKPGSLRAKRLALFTTMAGCRTL